MQITLSLLRILIKCNNHEINDNVENTFDMVRIILLKSVGAMITKLTVKLGIQLMLFNDGNVLQLRSETVYVRRRMIYGLDEL